MDSIAFPFWINRSEPLSSDHSQKGKQKWQKPVKGTFSRWRAEFFTFMSQVVLLH